MAHPQEAVLITAELQVLVQALQYKPFVLGIKLRRYKVEDVVKIKFLVRVILRNIQLVEFGDGLLFFHDIPNVVGV